MGWGPFQPPPPLTISINALNFAKLHPIFIEESFCAIKNRMIATTRVQYVKFWPILNLNGKNISGNIFWEILFPKENVNNSVNFQNIIKDFRLDVH